MLGLCGVAAVVGIGLGADGWGPVREDHLAARSGTVVHVDFAHAASTALGRVLLEQMSSDGEEDIFDAFTTDLGIEPGEEITGLTIYSLEGGSLGAAVGEDEVSLRAGGEQVVMLVYGTGELARWDELLAAEQDDASQDFIGGRPVREIDREEEHWLGVMLPDGEGVVWVVAPGLSQLESAVGVMDGRLERADLGSWSIEGPPAGAFVFLAVRDFEHMEGWGASSDVGKHAEGFSAALGQHGDRGFARVRVTVKSEEDAVAITGVCHGLVSLAQLTLREEESLRPLLKLAGRIRISAEDRIVEASLDEEASELAELLGGLGGGE